MTHRVETIMQAMVTVCTGLTTTAGRVYRGRAYPVPKSDPNAIVIFQGQDEIQTDLLLDNVISQVGVYVDAVAREPTADVSTTLNLISEETGIAIASNHTLNLSFVQSVLFVSSDEPDISDEGDTPLARMRSLWNVTYWRSRTNPGA